MIATVAGKEHHEGEGVQGQGVTSRNDGDTRSRDGNHTASSNSTGHRHRYHGRHRRHNRGKRRRPSKDGKGANGANARQQNEQQDEEEDKMKLLREFIPYFGTGDATSDSMVRSILGAADAEELTEDGNDDYGNTLLILACQYRCTGLVPLILAKGGGGAIDVNAVNSAGACALHFACYSGSLCMETAVLLLERGASPELAEKTHGCNPLHYAAGAGNVDLCKRLIEAGANTRTCDFHRYTAIDYAKHAGAEGCVAYLERVTAATPGAANAAGEAGVHTSAAGVETDVVGTPIDSMCDDGQLRRQTSFLREFGSDGEEREGYWGRECDPESGLAYYLNVKTGESAWENELLSQARALEESTSDEEVCPPLERWLMQETQRARLVAYLGRHDPLGVMQADELLKQRLGDEENLFAELVKKYGVEEDPAFSDLIKDARRGFRGRRSAANCAVSPRQQQAPSAAAKVTDTEITFDGKKGQDLVRVSGAAAVGARRVAGTRPPTAPCHGPGKRMGTWPMMRTMGSSKGLGSCKDLGGFVDLAKSTSSAKLLPTAPFLVSPEDMKAFQEQRLEEARVAHEETLEAERQVHRERVAQGEGAIARLEHDLKEAAAEEERLLAKTNEQERLAKDLGQKIEAKRASQSAALKALSEEAAALRSELKSATDETKACMDLFQMHGPEKSGLAATAELSRRDAEVKAKEESDLVQACQQASITAAKSDAERARRDFENQRRTEKQELQDRLGMKLNCLQQELAKAKAKAAVDISRAQSDAAAATSKAENANAIWAEVSAQQETMRADVERITFVAEQNTLLQGMIASESERRKKACALHNKMEDLKGKIRVYVRIRPLSEKEISRGCKEAVNARGKKTIAVQDPRAREEKTFEFDQVWAGSEEQGNDQLSIFRDTGYLVTSAVDGYNVCIFAYGQTGSGKTFTMFGAGGVGGGVDASTGQCDGSAGVTPRAVLELFRVLKERESQYEYSVKVSMFELYKDSLRDLLAKKGSHKKLAIKLAEHSETGLVAVEGGVEKDANDIAAMINIIQLGAEGRTVSATQMNADSSRSHLLCSIVVTSINKRTGSSVRGKLTLVDLAGSERVGKSGATGEQLKEAQSINKSLSALGDVIGALTTGIKHIPYRNHTLTMMMSDSLGGDSKTLMFMCASPADYNTSETLNALQFAARCKSVVNSAGSCGGAAAAAQVQALRRELEKLKGEGVGKEAAKAPTQLARPL
ncbi:unnamed protein product [Ascophyllum nodosum]